ncbi:uncharacterized protein LOC118432995 [Folsomia candida]|uniref:Uncharacterized protein n=1 Tax=Folsomia candida TaxID=158441 RepID=A0A226D2Z1_FOLCA|nr:uncharacterized protein LOC118432995 [Folsomia candida]OXA39513.1 hypothetical protein Fcan01_25726 [Folsomia candida]
MALSIISSSEYAKVLQHMTTIIHFCEHGPIDENGRRMRIVSWILTFMRGINVTVAESRSCIRVIRNFEASPMTPATSSTSHIMYPWEATIAAMLHLYPHFENEDISLPAMRARWDTGDLTIHNIIHPENENDMDHSGKEN